MENLKKFFLRNLSLSKSGVFWVLPFQKTGWTGPGVILKGLGI